MNMDKSTITKATLASLLGSSSASAFIVVNTPLDVSGEGDRGAISLNWDIDGDLIREGRVRGVGSVSSISSQYGRGSLIASGGKMSFAIDGANLANVSTAGSVGTNYVFGAGGRPFFNSNGSLDSNDFASLDTPTAVIGFRFDISGSNHYGVASVTWGIYNTSGITLVVNKWAYNDVADASIPASTLNTVPEPATAALGLGALALGAAGLRRWRKNKAAKQVA